MIYKNVCIHNAEEILTNGDGIISWRRIPTNVYNSLESDMGKDISCDATGVELRFKMKSDEVTIRMSVQKGEGCFHVFRGAIQGGWEDHEVHKTVKTTVEDFTIKRSENDGWLKKMSEKAGTQWNSDVVRIIFDRGVFKIFDIIGDVEPPEQTDLPSKTVLCYGSSITHGSNSIDISHSWASLLAHNLDYDLKNKGMSGSCCMEPEFAEYIAGEGEKNHWDILTLELGINVLTWEDEKIYQRTENIIKQIAEKNPDKYIFVISPFYHCGDEFDKNDRAKIWRRIIKEIVLKYNYPNVKYINGIDILGDITLLSADFVHPNIYGAAQIAERLTDIIKPIVCK